MKITYIVSKEVISTKQTSAKYYSWCMIWKWWSNHMCKLYHKKQWIFDFQDKSENKQGPRF